MGDVTTQPHQVGIHSSFPAGDKVASHDDDSSNVGVKTLGKKLEASSAAAATATELAETPCHGRKASREAFAAANLAAAAGAGFTLKALAAAAAAAGGSGPLPGSPSTESDTPTPPGTSNGRRKTQHVFDTVTDPKSTLHLPGGAAAPAAGVSGSRESLSRVVGEIGVEETGGDGDGDSAGVIPESEATAEDSEEQTTLPLGRPASTRSGIPDFAALSEDEALSTGGESGAMADVSSCDSGEVEVDGSGGRSLPPRMADISKPISLDDLRFAGDEDDSANSDDVVVVVAGEGEAGVVVKGAEKLASPTGTGSTCEDATGPSSRASSNRRSDNDDGGGDVGTREMPSPSGGMSWVPAAPAMVAPATPAPPTATATTEGSAVVTDNRISPFYADNSSLWTTAAAAASRAEHARAPKPDANPFWSNSTSSSLSEGHHVRSASADSSAAAAAPGNNDNRLSARLRRAASNVSMLPITASSRVFPSRRFLSSNSAAVMMPPAPHSSQEPQSSLVLANDKLGDSSGAGHHIYDPADKIGHDIYDPAAKDAGKDGRAPAFGGDSFFGKTPLVSPLGSTASTAADEASSAGGSPRNGTSLAAARFEIEGDIEEGGTRPASADGEASAAAAAVADGSTGVAAVADVGDIMLAAAATAEQETVLPCAPTDKEKVLYLNTNRFAIVSCAIISFITLTWGMWLFTIVTPAFYWFGAPAIFLIFYTAWACLV
ncbi:unnamed protein product [Ectocarpus fasciculatus]